MIDAIDGPAESKVRLQPNSRPSGSMNRPVPAIITEKRKSRKKLQERVSSRRAIPTVVNRLPRSASLSSIRRCACCGSKEASGGGFEALGCRMLPSENFGQQRHILAQQRAAVPEPLLRCHSLSNFEREASPAAGVQKFKQRMTIEPQRKHPASTAA